MKWERELNWIELNWIELNGIWVRALLGLMHLGLKTGPLCHMFCTKLKEPCSFSKVPDGVWKRSQKSDKAEESNTWEWSKLAKMT